MSVLFLLSIPLYSFFFFFNDTATTEIYTLSLHDALPICRQLGSRIRILGNFGQQSVIEAECAFVHASLNRDRKSTRLNSSHLVISYAVFCLKKKKTLTHRNDAPTHAYMCHYVPRHRDNAR